MRTKLYKLVIIILIDFYDILFMHCQASIIVFAALDNIFSYSNTILRKKKNHNKLCFTTILFYFLFAQLPIFILLELHSLRVWTTGPNT